MLPVVISIIFYFLKRCTAFKGLSFAVKQVIIGTVFGLAAIFGTVLGVDIGGATANCRDAAPLCAGFFFGGPAGIIAGIIGGVYRWISAPATGMYTRVACSVSTVAAGLYAAALRKYIFEFRRPGWMMVSLVGLVMEVFHMSMVFVTHFEDIETALEVIKIATVPMVFCNAFACGFTAFLLDVISRKVLHRHSSKLKKKINERIQFRMLIAVIAAFAVASAAIFAVQSQMAVLQTDLLLDINMADVTGDIQDIIDKNMLNAAHMVAEAYEKDPSLSPESLAELYDVTEIDVVDRSGEIIKSNFREFVGYDMKSGRQSAEFMILTRGVKELVQPITLASFSPEGTSPRRKYAGVALADGGFIQVGYDQTTLMRKVREQLPDLTKNRHIGSTGGISIVDYDLNVVSSTYGGRGPADPAVIFAGDTAKGPGTLFKGTVNEKRCFCKYAVAEGYYILAYLPYAEALLTRDLEVYVNTFVMVMIFAAMFAWIFFLVKRLVTDNIYRVNQSLRKITEGDLDERVSVHTDQEFDELSDAINATVQRLEDYTVEVQERINQELEIARNIQQSSLPTNFEEFDAYREVDVFATMDPAREIGGDFYDFVMKDNTLSFGIADVSGKGIPGALFMMRSKATLRNCVDAGLRIDDTFTLTNDRLCEGNEAEMFVTAWMGMLDIASGHVEFANAGHNPPLVYRKGEGYSYLKSRVGLVLGGMSGMLYKLQELQLKPGDKIFLYTDGVTEAQNRNKEFYGEERLISCLNAHMDADEEETVSAVRADLDEFAGGAEQFDDITMMLVRYNGNEGTAE